MSRGLGDVYKRQVNQSLTLTGDNLRLTRVSAPSLQINSDPDISITDSHFTKTASKIITADSDIHLTNNQFKALKLTSSEGDIMLNNNRITESLSATASDGDIRITAPRTTGVKASTSDGDLHISIISSPMAVITRSTNRQPYNTD